MIASSQRRTNLRERECRLNPQAAPLLDPKCLGLSFLHSTSHVCMCDGVQQLVTHGVCSPLPLQRLAVECWQTKRSTPGVYGTTRVPSPRVCNSPLRETCCLWRHNTTGTIPSPPTIVVPASRVSVVCMCVGVMPAPVSHRHSGSTGLWWRPYDRLPKPPSCRMRRWSPCAGWNTRFPQITLTW